MAEKEGGFWCAKTSSGTYVKAGAAVAVAVAAGMVTMATGAMAAAAGTDAVPVMAGLVPLGTPTATGEATACCCWMPSMAGAAGTLPMPAEENGDSGVAMETGVGMVPTTAPFGTMGALATIPLSTETPEAKDPTVAGSTLIPGATEFTPDKVGKVAVSKEAAGWDADGVKTACRRLW